MEHLHNLIQFPLPLQDTGGRVVVRLAVGTVGSGENQDEVTSHLHVSVENKPLGCLQDMVVGADVMCRAMLENSSLKRADMER